MEVTSVRLYDSVVTGVGMKRRKMAPAAAAAEAVAVSTVYTPSMRSMRRLVAEVAEALKLRVGAATVAGLKDMLLVLAQLRLLVTGAWRPKLSALGAR